MKPFGIELLLDCYECDGVTVDDITVVYDFLQHSVETLGVSQQAPPFVFHSPSSYVKNGKVVDCSDKAGISAWVPLLESGIQIHTLTDKNFISIDFYTCGRMDKIMIEDMIKLTKLTFSPKRIVQKVLPRGEKYYKK